MEYRIREHARMRMVQRGVSESEIETVIRNPQQIVDVDGGRKAYQSLIVKDGRIYLLRLVVDDQVSPIEVYTVYLTTDAIRYWQP